jgi:hypothetical protein
MNVLEVGRGAVGALGKQIGATVDQIVEDHQPQIAAAQFVKIGKAEGDFCADGGVGPILDDGVEFAAGVAGGLFHLVQHAVERARNLVAVG